MHQLTNYRTNMQRHTDFIDAMGAISTLTDVARRGPAVLVFTGLGLALIGLILLAR